MSNSPHPVRISEASSSLHCSHFSEGRLDERRVVYVAADQGNLGKIMAGAISHQTTQRGQTNDDFYFDTRKRQVTEIKGLDTLLEVAAQNLNQGQIRRATIIIKTTKAAKKALIEGLKSQLKGSGLESRIETASPQFLQIIESSPTVEAPLPSGGGAPAAALVSPVAAPLAQVAPPAPVALSRVEAAAAAKQWPPSLTANAEHLNPDLSNRELTAADLGLWMAMNVGPYKPIGYAELDYSDAVQAIRSRHPSNKPHGPARREKDDKIRRELQAKADQALKEGGRGNRALPQRTHYRYNVEAIAELLSLNIVKIKEYSKYKENENHPLEPIFKALAKGDKEESSRLLATFFSSNNAENYFPQSFIHALFADPVFEQDQTGPNRIKCPKGLQQLIDLHKQFSLHNWDTIRNLLVYFEQNGFADPVSETRKMLSQLKEPGYYYFVHNHTLFRTNKWWY